MSILKGDKVKFNNNGTILEGVAISNQYLFVTENNLYVDVLFNDLKEVLPLNIKCLEKVD